MTVPVLQHGCETRIPTKKIKNQIQNSEMKFMRRTDRSIWATRQNRLRNQYIREEPQIFCIIDKIQTHRREWLQRLDRMEDERLPKVAFRYRPFGTRDVGRSRVRWRDTL